MSFFFMVVDKLKYSSRGLYYVSACIVGLGLARLVDVSILAYVSSNKDTDIIKSSSNRMHESLVSQGNVDVLSIIGGFLYAPAPAIEESPSEVQETQINYTLIGTLEGPSLFC